MLNVENVSVRFGGLVAVDSISFDTDTNRILCIIGPNGAGKTTLFSVLSGFLRPTLRQVRFNGLDVSSMRLTRSRWPVSRARSRSSGRFAT